jgi:hypothetical protein
MEQMARADMTHDARRYCLASRKISQGPPQCIRKRGLTEIGNDRNTVGPKLFLHPARDKSVEAGNLVERARALGVVVVSCAVACPHYEVDGVCPTRADVGEGGVDEAQGRVASAVHMSVDQVSQNREHSTHLAGVPHGPLYL